MHRRGKVARLPQELRQLVNRMLADGAEYKQVIVELEKLMMNSDSRVLRKKPAATQTTSPAH